MAKGRRPLFVALITVGKRLWCIVPRLKWNSETYACTLLRRKIASLYESGAVVDDCEVAQLHRLGGNHGFWVGDSFIEAGVGLYAGDTSFWIETCPDGEKSGDLSPPPEWTVEWPTPEVWEYLYCEE